jgi:hypothetical protein
MLASTYIEDIFVEFFVLMNSLPSPFQYQDIGPANSFFNVIANDRQLTQNQANYVLKLLQKYKNIAKTNDLDYTAELVNPQWKNPFRTLDMTKKVWVEHNEEKILTICLKFPYNLKSEFDTEIEQYDGMILNRSGWDSERRIRILPLYDFNIIQINEFVQKHRFEIDDSFVDALSAVEEIWQNQNTVLPHSVVTEHGVVLFNSTEDAEVYFDEHATGNVINDLMLAKNMGYLLKAVPSTVAEKIAATSKNSFWIKYNKDFLSLCQNVNGKVCIIIDRSSNALEWLKEFASAIKEAGIDNSTVKVCFRMPKDDESGLNAWVSENGFGGKVEEGNILIFSHKPAKWLFKEIKSVTMLVTNNLYPSTNPVTKDWLHTHPCVIYLGDIKPSLFKDQNIVEL